MFDGLIDFIKSVYPEKEKIFLHEPYMGRLEEDYVLDSIRSGFVSSVGEYVVRAETKIAELTKAKYAVAVSSGTAALHTALISCGVKSGDLVITQPLSFVATGNAIKYCNADPFFIDIDDTSLSLSPEKLEEFLLKETEERKGCAVHKKTGRKISACVPMHTFGHIGKIDKISEICGKFKISLIEDAAEAMGSTYQGRHAGIFGKAGILSFNGNKIITSGGGGAIITDDEEIYRKAKHISTTARTDNPVSHEHDMVGYNYRMPNLNASFLYAQLLRLNDFVEKKRRLGKAYEKVCKNNNISFFTEPDDCRSNYWLNSIILNNSNETELFIKTAQKNNIFPRMVWKPLHKLDFFEKTCMGNLDNTDNFYRRIVNLPSSVTEEI